MLEWIIISAFILSFILSFGLGANDVSNAFATSVGAKVISLRNACILASIAEFLGCVLLGANVTSKITSGIVSDLPKTTYMVGMLSVLFSVGVWLLTATYFKLPVSATHAVVSAIVGFSLLADASKIQWDKMIGIGVSWVVSPLLSGTVSLILSFIVRHLVMNREYPFRAGLKLTPLIYVITVGINIIPVSNSLVSHFGIFKDELWPRVGVCAGIVASFCLLTLVVVYSFILPMTKKSIMEMEFENDEAADLADDMPHSFIKPRLSSSSLSRTSLIEKDDPNPFIQKQRAEQVFSKLQIMTAVFTSFAHGSNDVSNSVGPILGIYNLFFGMDLSTRAPNWLLVYGAVGIILGLSLLGSRVIKTLGKDLTPMSPSKGFAIELGAAMTVLIATIISLPVSSTHCKVGSIVMVGMSQGVNWKLCANILLSWIVTIPFGGMLSVGVFALLRMLI